ncbi:MAG: 2,3-bisphosphoglycerate-independent phosphoglycerate mutase [Coriobacteriales bacterium]|jgi:2,3-bisphosphoglycerate-independent phosphoglycerate mutase|nr:2,3-bisphosphoglycerate-independent phosphoglycerate mutase [Coriobacteriales bacterium]
MATPRLHLPVLLAILDGVGIAPASPKNALSEASTPFLDRLFGGQEFPYTELEASGEAVGLPAGQMGNSEVGHLNIGAGRVVHQELSRINQAIADGSFFSNAALTAACSRLKAGQVLHLMGLFSEGGVHSELSHLKALVELAGRQGAHQVYVHAFMDGRDVAPTSGAGFMKDFLEWWEQTKLDYPELSLRIATVHGRFFAMDRDQRWERLQRSYRCLTDPKDGGEAFKPGANPVALLEDSYAHDISDEFVLPVALQERGLKDGDSLVFFNFRPDRAREITRALIDPAFKGFKRAKRPKLHYVCMTEYDPAFLEMGAALAFAKEFPDNVLADVLAAAGLRQLHTAETEKYAHVTFFLNGGKEEPKPLEERVLVPSPKVATYDLKPEMSAYEVADQLVDAIDEGRADFYVVNFANGDMVGHTGNLKAAVQALQTVDLCLERVLLSLTAQGGAALVTADHGNCEIMADAKGNPVTSHTTSPVPCALVSGDLNAEPAKPRADLAGVKLRQDKDCKLADLAPTILDLIGLPKPQEFSGKSLIA